MSIAEDEAERVYPTRYWDGTHVKEKFYCDTDDLQEAYLRGREAPPSDVEVEAVAAIFTTFFVCVWEEATTARTIITRDGSQSYACTISDISPTPHDYKPIKDTEE